MPNTNWSKLSHLQLGRYAEYYAKWSFLLMGMMYIPLKWMTTV